MTSRWLAGAAFALTIFGANAQTAPMTSASGAMAASASAAKMKKPMRARVTGGPGYVSEGSAATASAASSTPPGKRRARVTGGPGGTAGTPDTK